MTNRCTGTSNAYISVVSGSAGCVGNQNDYHGYSSTRTSLSSTTVVVETAASHPLRLPVHYTGQAGEQSVPGGRFPVKEYLQEWYRKFSNDINHSNQYSEVYSSNPPDSLIPSYPQKSLIPSFSQNSLTPSVSQHFLVPSFSHNSLIPPNSTTHSRSMAMLFPWTYYFANRRIPRSYESVSDSPDLEDYLKADELSIWPYHGFQNATAYSFGSGDYDLQNSTTFTSLPPIESYDGWALNFWIHGVLMPFIAIFGIGANLASFVVLTRRVMRSAVINTYLAALSAFDGILLFIALLLYPPMAYCEYYGSDASSGWCRYFFHTALITYPLSLIAQCGSVWTLTAITVDRFVAITWPLESRKWCTNRRALIVSISILIWSILYNIPAFFELKLVDHPIEFDENGRGTYFVEVLDRTDLRKSTEYVRAYKGYCYLIFMLLLPAGTMIALNAYVTVSVRKASRNRQRTMNVSPNVGREDKERRCTVMAILVVATFLLLNSLAFVNNMLEALWSEDELSKVNFVTFVCIGNVLVALNSATNFFIYYAFGLRFRQMLCKLFCCCCYTPEREYQYLSVYYGSGRNYCWTNGRDGGGNGTADPLLSGPGGGGGIISMKTLPSIRRSQRRADSNQNNTMSISSPFNSPSVAHGANRRTPSTGARISPPLDSPNFRSYQNLQRPTNIMRVERV